LGAALEFVPLPWLYWTLLTLIIGSYMILAEQVKTWFILRWGN